MNSGIYIIRNTVTGDHYVGSSANFKRRKSCHWSQLRRNCHCSPILQNSWNKYGAEHFQFEVVELASEESLLLREQHWMDETKPRYNVAKIAGRTTGYRHSEEYKEMMRIKGLGREFTPETKERIGDANRGKKRSAETREKLKNKEVTQAQREKLSLAHTGKKRSEEHCQNISVAKKGKKLSEATRQKMREAWTLRSKEEKAAEKAKHYLVISPSGEKFAVKNLSEFCRTHDIGSSSGLYQVANGKIKHYKGWTCSHVASPQTPLG